MLRDRDEAADITQDAFLVAAERLGQLRDPQRLRPWLYVVARSQALRRVQARSRLAPEEDMTDLPDSATGPEQAAHAYVLLTRLRDQVERSPGALLVAHLGRDDCPDLVRVLSDWLEQVQLTSAGLGGGWWERWVGGG